MFGPAQSVMLAFPFERPMFMREYATGTCKLQHATLVCNVWRSRLHCCCFTMPCTAKECLYCWAVLSCSAADGCPSGILLAELSLYSKKWPYHRSRTYHIIILCNLQLYIICTCSSLIVTNSSIRRSCYSIFHDEDDVGATANTGADICPIYHVLLHDQSTGIP